MNFLWFAFEVTERCNLACEFCYNVWREKQSTAQNDLSAEEVNKIFRNISSVSGAIGITLTGGEPLLRNDIAEIAGSASRTGLKVALSTNGTLLNSRKVSELVKSGVQHFDIGFSDPSSETRLALTAAAKAGCSVTACICLHRNNYNRIGVLTSLAAALGADSIAINRFVPTGRGKKNRENLVPDTMNLLSALAMANETAIASGIHIYTGIPVEPCIASNEKFPGISFSTCQCGETKWAIDPGGNLRTCEQNKTILGNLLETSFEDILNRNTVEIQKFRQWRPLTGCKSCEQSSGCTGGCRFQFF